ncbi:39S ribosomal protein L21, mitochondrial [Anguilla anguilla]|uniref:39S ribosomal protein L21, mitochondrial n=1 Tax=Anguilla anguilla TaxID=7936 RepID=UPI0015ADFFD5|nr:39S ribosomal protein L21, mitochondrial [Anguilla anguilla]
MAVTLRNALREALQCGWRFRGNKFPSPLQAHTGFLLPAVAGQSSQSITNIPSRVPETSLSRPPWPELPIIDHLEEAKRHQAVVQKVSNILASRDYGRLFAVVHFASRQWKVTNEDLIIIENHIDVECGERIRLEKVLLVGGEEFTLIGRPLLSRDLVRVEATVIEKTDSWPRVHLRFLRRHRYQRKRIIIQPQTVLRINTVEIAPNLS